MGLRNQSGNVFLVLMMGMLLLGLVGGGFFVFGNRASQGDKLAEDALQAFNEAIDNMELAMSSPRSVEISLDRNAGFQCFFSNDGKCGGQGGLFLLYDSAQAARALSHLARNTGSDSYGAACKGYPSRECPLRVETVWEPVCGGAYCEGTKSLRVKATVTLASMSPGEAPYQWYKEGLFTPRIQLSQATQCARGGGVWAGTECLTPGQAAERQVASRGGARPDARTLAQSDRDADRRREEEMPQPMQPVVYECPNQIVVQGQYYSVQFLAADRGQVSVPAMSCPYQGNMDVFVFQCVAKAQPTFPSEGQWVQVEAVMAPPCDGNGYPSGTLPTRF